MSLRIFIKAIEDQELWRSNQYLVISCDEEAFRTSWAISFLQCNMFDDFNNGNLRFHTFFHFSPARNAERNG